MGKRYQGINCCIYDFQYLYNFDKYRVEFWFCDEIKLGNVVGVFKFIVYGDQFKYIEKFFIFLYYY